MHISDWLCWNICAKRWLKPLLWSVSKSKTIIYSKVYISLFYISIFQILSPLLTNLISESYVSLIFTFSCCVIHYLTIGIDKVGTTDNITWYKWGRKEENSTQDTFILFCNWKESFWTFNYQYINGKDFSPNSLNRMLNLTEYICE